MDGNHLTEKPRLLGREAPMTLIYGSFIPDQKEMDSARRYFGRGYSFCGQSLSFPAVDPCRKAL